MNKHLAIILTIFILPIALYWGFSREKNVSILPSVAFSGAEIIKFSSPMCYECQELEKIFNEVYPQYANKISLRKIDVTQKDKSVRELIKKYDVKLVPTCVFRNDDGVEIRKTEGMIQTKILENYMKELLNG